VRLPAEPVPVDTSQDSVYPVASLAVSLSLTSFYARYNIFDSEQKEYSRALAEACVDAVLLQLSTAPSSAGGVFGSNTTVGTASQICSTSARDDSVAGQVRFATKADYQHYISAFSIRVRTSDLSILSWEEIANPGF
jgi:hypothetical protein